MILGYKVFLGACLDEEVACQFSCDAVVCQLRRVALQAIFCHGDDITKADLAMNKAMGRDA
jgi:hypothetical protein